MCACARIQGDLVCSFCRALKLCVSKCAPTQGDLVVHLAEAAREELDKPVRDISRPRLQSLLELAIRTSSVAQVCVYACVFTCAFVFAWSSVAGTALIEEAPLCYKLAQVFSFVYSYLNCFQHESIRGK